MTRRMVAALLVGVAGAASAQTAIAPDTVAAATTGTTAAPAGNITLIDGGARAGNNLFHSFASFSLATGDLALWTRAANDGATIANIVNRVTGGTASAIDGTLATEGMPNASFWFINPAGIVFGADASVAVPNAAHFSTAAGLRFADGAIFAVATPGGSVLSVAAPAAFGFVGTQGDISVTGAQPAFVSPDTRLSLTAANVSITGSTLTAGSLDLAAVGTGTGTVSVGDPAAVRFGNGRIALTDSFVSAEPGPLMNGAIRAMAARLDVTASNFSSDSNDRTAAGLRLVVGALRVTASVTPDAPQAYLGSFASGAGNAGAVAIRADSILVSGTSQISTQALETATGNAGDIAIDAGALTVDNGGSIVTSAYGNSTTGNVRIDAASVSLRSGGFIESTTYGGGVGGNVVLHVGSLSIDDARIASEAEAGSSGSAGSVEIAASGLVSLTNGGLISSSTFGSGDAGLIDITAPQIVLDLARIASEAETGSTGEAGAVVVTGTLLRLVRDSAITSSSYGPGLAGAVGIDVASLIVDDSAITSAALGEGDGGDIAVTAKSVALTNGAFIATSTLGPGIGGDIAVEADSIALSGGSMISSDLVGGGDGFAGTVSVSATTLSVASLSEISSATIGTGDAGFVKVAAKAVTLDGGLINTSTYGAGAAGLVELDADTLTIINRGSIVSETTASGAAGAIDVKAGTIRLASGGTIQSSTSDAGDAGAILIQATDIRLDPGGRILSSQIGAQATGNAGAIAIQTDTLVAARASSPAISTSILTAGIAGEIGIQARAITLDGAEIASSANGTRSGTSGAVAIETKSLSLVNGGSIETSSANPDLAGAISIEAAQLIVQGTGSRIASENKSTRGGPAGSIAVSSDDLRILDGAAITTDSLNGAAGDITIDMAPGSTLLLRARSGPASFITTSSGPGTGGVITIASPYLILSDGGAILAKGQAFGADVLISSNFYIRSADRTNQLSVDGALIVDSEVGDLSTGSESIDLSFLDASSVLRGQCATARTGGVSQLSARITGPYVPLVRPVPMSSAISFDTRFQARCG